MSDAAEVEMFESGWFGRIPAFWRCVETPEARPYVEAFTQMRRRPDPDEPLNLLGDDDGADLLDPDYLENLTGDIQLRFGGDVG